MHDKIELSVCSCVVCLEEKMDEMVAAKLIGFAIFSVPCKAHSTDNKRRFG